MVPSYTVEYNAVEYTVWCGMQNQNIQTCPNKVRGQTLTSSGTCGPRNPPLPLPRSVPQLVAGTITSTIYQVDLRTSAVTPLHVGHFGNLKRGVCGPGDLGAPLCPPPHPALRRLPAVAAWAVPAMHSDPDPAECRVGG